MTQDTAVNSPGDYRQMWADLGLDLARHDALLGALGELYRTTFLSQPNRPAGMGYFDFVMSEVHGLRIRELLDAKAQGRIVVGSFCTFVPEELILAVDGISVGLCTGAEFGTEAAERFVPRATCSLIKSAFGFALERVCPYLASSDLVVGENTCDGKKKNFEEFAGLVPRFMQLDMPQTRAPHGHDLLESEYRRFAVELERLSGRTITVESLRQAATVVNAKRAALARLMQLRAADPAPISGLDALLIEQVAFYDDPIRFTGAVNTLCDELAARVAAGEGVFPQNAPRVLLSGCPMAVPNWKLPAIVEAAGAVVVGEESCVGERSQRHAVRTDAATLDDWFAALTERYLRIDCAVFTPNPGRLEHARAMYADRRAGGVIHYALQFCTPYQVEAIGLERRLEAESVPVLRVETDYGAEDVGQLRTRVEAFVERLRA